MNPQIGSTVQVRPGNGSTIIAGIVTGNIRTVGSVTTADTFCVVSGHAWSVYSDVTLDDTLSAKDTFRVVAGGM
jgi:hypothetical protein